MAPTLRYHCVCSSALAIGSSRQPPLANLKSSDVEFHPLTSLYFCEECDAVRCPRCVALEVSGYYCPNCLFEVPSASVRGEKNRCARNCFQCPHCHNTLSVVPSDPPERDPGSRLPVVINPVGEPPFILHCSFCRWDSQEVGISFEKPTGLALQLQRFEDSAPETLEFDRLKDHFEPLIRAAGSGPVSHASARHNPITAAASHALAREVHGVPRHQLSKTAGRTGKSKALGDPWDAYQARNSASGGDSAVGATGGAEDVEWMRNLECIEDVAPVEARWDASWSGSLRASSLAPLRIPLHSKMSVRCATCRHILIKPEQKSQSVRYKIKLMASNYLPLLDPSLISTANAPARLVQGRSFPFSITITNPLYDSIQVRFQPHNPATYPNISRPSFHITLPQALLSVAAFAEAWEYDDDEEEGDQDQMMLDALEGGAGLADVVKAGGHSTNPSRGKSGTIGVLERRANMIRVGGEVAVSRDGTGDIKFTMLVTYQYRAEEPAEDQTQGHAGRSPASQLKSFSFLTMLNLGTIHTKEQLKEHAPVGK
ncbi:dynactin p62 [Ceratobasidium sp. AG-I]|nr:dynactin p62 [Ceratobasidium sp. AG-I]